MNCLEETPQSTEGESTPMLGALFAIAWSSADEASLPQLPEAIGSWMRAARVRLLIARWDGAVVHDYTYEAPGEAGYGAAGEKSGVSFELPLGTEMKLNLNIHMGSSGGRSVQLPGSLDEVLGLIHAALENLLIAENDRVALGPPFALLSDREWQVCRALVGSEAEKQIADLLGWSRHTLHTKVKRVYRKLEVQSRLEMVQKLRQARLRIRRKMVATLAQFGRPDAAWTEDRTDTNN